MRKRANRLFAILLGSLFNDRVAQQQNLGQDAHHQEDGDQCAPAQTHADGGDGLVIQGSVWINFSFPYLQNEWWGTPHSATR